MEKGKDKMGVLPNPEESVGKNSSFGPERGTREHRQINISKNKENLDWQMGSLIIKNGEITEQ